MKNEIIEIVKKTATQILLENGTSYDDNNIILYSKNGLFDSMDLVNFISILEEQLNILFHKPIQLSHPSVFSNNKSPFKDISTTVEFILSIL
jgi:acyl carrier protein